MRILRAGVLYFVLVFGTGFLFGVVRVPFLVPRLGVRVAELVEMPFMLLAIVLSARYVNRLFALPPTAAVRLLVGFFALALVVSAELSFAFLLQGQSAAGYVASRDPVSGTAYLGTLALFALMPFILAHAQAVRITSHGEQP
jgi:hypothetical protein